MTRKAVCDRVLAITLDVFSFLVNALTILFGPFLFLLAIGYLWLGVTLVAGSTFAIASSSTITQYFYWVPQLQLISLSLCYFGVGILQLKLSIFIFRRIAISLKMLIRSAHRILTVLGIGAFLGAFIFCIFDDYLKSAQPSRHRGRGSGNTFW